MGSGNWAYSARPLFNSRFERENRPQTFCLVFSLTFRHSRASRPRATRFELRFRGHTETKQQVPAGSWRRWPLRSGTELPSGHLPRADPHRLAAAAPPDGTGHPTGLPQGGHRPGTAPCGLRSVVSDEMQEMGPVPFSFCKSTQARAKGSGSIKASRATYLRSPSSSISTPSGSLRSSMES